MTTPPEPACARRRPTRGALTALAGGMLLAAAHCAVAQQAMVMDVTSGVTSRVGGKTAKAELLAYLDTGAEIALAEKASARLVLLATSAEVALVGPGRYRLRAGGLETLLGATPAPQPLNPDIGKQARTFAPAARDRMALAAVVMRAAGPPGVPRRLAPNDVTVLDPAPQLWWQAEEARNVSITVSDASGQVVWQGSAGSAGVRLGKALPPGRYTWTAAGDAGVSMAASFDVASDAQRSALPAPSTDAAFSQRMVTAMVWDNAGYSHDAWMLWRQLAAERPDSASLAKLAQ